MQFDEKPLSQRDDYRTTKETIHFFLQTTGFVVLIVFVRKKWIWHACVCCFRGSNCIQMSRRILGNSVCWKFALVHVFVFLVACVSFLLVPRRFRAGHQCEVGRQRSRHHHARYCHFATDHYQCIPFNLPCVFSYAPVYQAKTTCCNTACWSATATTLARRIVSLVPNGSHPWDSGG